MAEHLTCSRCDEYPVWTMWWAPLVKLRYACHMHTTSVLNDAPRGIIITVRGLP